MTLEHSLKTGRLFLLVVNTGQQPLLGLLVQMSTGTAHDQRLKLLWRVFLKVKQNTSNTKKNATTSGRYTRTNSVGAYGCRALNLVLQQPLFKVGFRVIVCFDIVFHKAVVSQRPLRRRRKNNMHGETSMENIIEHSHVLTVCT